MFETGKIESAEALPYHQFTVPPFPFSVCVSCCMSSLYNSCLPRLLLYASITEAKSLHLLCSASESEAGSDFSLWSLHSWDSFITFISDLKPDLYILLVAVLRRRPGVVVVVEAGLAWQPAVVVEGCRRGDLIVADLPRLHAQRHATVERWWERRETERAER